MDQCTHDPGNGFCFASLLLSVVTTSALEHNGKGTQTHELVSGILAFPMPLTFASCVHKHMCYSASGGHNGIITPEQ